MAPEHLLHDQLWGFLSLGKKNSEDPGRMSSWCFLAMNSCLSTQPEFPHMSNGCDNSAYFLGSLAPYMSEFTKCLEQRDQKES